MIYQGARRYPVREIIIHCSATRPEWMQRNTLAEKVKEIRRWHVDNNGWRDIGYHWLIDRDGQVAAGRREIDIGAHVSGKNNGTIGICLLGGLNSTGRNKFEELFTVEQDTALKRLIADIRGRTSITNVTGHNQYSNKACPGFNVTSYLRERRIQS